MDIVVCVKQVPDTTARKELGPDFLLNRGQLEGVINPFDEYALEEALRLKEAHGGDVTVLTMGPSSAEDSMRKALAMGADKGVLVTDPALAGSDWRSTCRVLAKAIQTISHDIVLTGMESTDARAGIVPGGLAELLDVPAITFAAKLEVDGGTLRVDRQIPGGYQEIEAQLPVLVSIVKGANEPRYPSLKGIMASKRKEIRKLGLADLGIEPSDVGLAGTRTPVIEAAPRPEKAAGQVLKSDSPEAAAAAIADFLQANKLI